ncbi:PEP-protein phosphotransferase of PTS system (enzyme I) (fragment) [uncultured Alphaproteobacteria bacterium]|uniref:PEP-protein phosphotransferase of PTS system (Enzyme I) n=1 Tax=uncultured Alphaproteobacteria bacterium TaxID=91750 RepID=A0A212JRR1_9PROT
MADGTRLPVYANVGSVGDAARGAAFGAEGSGLVRTEFVFLDRRTAPTEAEQLAEYQAMADAMHGRPLTVRTLDIGGDKPIPYLPHAAEENPILGVRGIRMSRRHPEMLRQQFRAILRMAPLGQCRIMLPMVADPADLRWARAIFLEEKAALGIAAEVPLGIMIEVPSAVALADRLAAEADFFSIGTNDLTQYVLAMDRGNPALAAEVDAFHPAVLRMIAQTVAGARRHGRPVGVCGGLASEVLAAPILIGLGVTSLSATRSGIPELKAFIRTLDADACRAVAEAALEQDTADAVRALVRARWPDCLPPSLADVIGGGTSGEG